MRPGAAVRLRGTWVDEIKGGPGESGVVSQDGSSDANGGRSKVDVADTSATPEDSSVTSTTTDASKSITAELQVTEVELLGPSDPQVRSWPPMAYLREAT